MAKQLVQRSNVAEYICRETGKMYVDGTILLAPGAKDYLSEKGIPIVYGSPPEESSRDQQTPAASELEEQALCKQVAHILKHTYGIADEVQVAAISRQVLKRLQEPCAPAGKSRARDVE